MLEAIEICQKISGKELNHTYKDDNRSGDHIWYISDLSKFKARYPNWSIAHDVPQILQEIHDKNIEKWA